jgi:hypothetical protein
MVGGQPAGVRLREEGVVSAVSAALAASELRGTDWSTTAVAEGYAESAQLRGRFGDRESV